MSLISLVGGADSLHTSPVSPDGQIVMWHSGHLNVVHLGRGCDTPSRTSWCGWISLSPRSAEEPHPARPMSSRR
jgi:hypothetical protein